MRTMGSRLGSTRAERLLVACREGVEDYTQLETNGERARSAAAGASHGCAFGATLAAMDPKRSPAMLLAPPPPSSSGAMRFPSARELPPIDERAVKPETREQLIRGRRVVAMPANPAHGDRHFDLDYVIRANIAKGYVGSTDLLTRSSESSDFATDTCIRKEGIDPITRTRYLEELAFEVVNEQSLRDITEQAEDLSARGVRRIVAIFVKKGEVREWSPKKGAWQALDLEGTFRDPTLTCPIRVKELLDAAEADDAVARALLAKNNPVIEAAKVESWGEGKKEGAKEGQLTHARAVLRRVLARRGLALSAVDESRIEACADLATLDRWLDAAVVAPSAADALQ